jgi:hypothetical protein
MAETKGLENINELITAQAKLYDDVLSGKVKHYTAKEATNAAGKIIAACKVQLEYALLRQERPCINFLGGEMTPTEAKYRQLRKNMTGPALANGEEA